MTTDEERINRIRTREAAAQMLADITALQREPAFERYWLKRLRQKHETIDLRFRRDDPSECSHEDREALRQLLLLIEELIRMPAQDRAVAERTLDTIQD